MSRRKKRRNYDWEAIEREYRAGQMTLRELQAAFGPAPSTITYRAQQRGWERDLSAKVQKTANAALLKADAESSNEVSNKEDEIVRTAAARVVEIIRDHRSTISKLHGATQKALKLAVAYFELANEQRETKSKKRCEAIGKELEQIRDAIGENPVAAMHKLSQTLDRVVHLERKSWNIEDKERTADDMIPLCDRLKTYQRERAISESENVTKMAPRGAAHSGNGSTAA